MSTTMAPPMPPRIAPGRTGQVEVRDDGLIVSDALYNAACDVAVALRRDPRFADLSPGARDKAYERLAHDIGEALVDAFKNGPATRDFFRVLCGEPDEGFSPVKAVRP